MLLRVQRVRGAEISDSWPCLAQRKEGTPSLYIPSRNLDFSTQHSDANTRLAPGDMISVDPAEIRFLQEPKPPKETESDESEDNSPPAKAHASASKTPDDLTPFHLPPYASPFIFLPAYAEVSFQTCSAVYVRHPTARPGYSEIPTPYDADGEVVRLAWEWYAKRRPRTRSKSQLQRLPEGRDRQVGGV